MIYTDITERKKAEEKIKQVAKFPSENPNPILRVSKDGYLLYSNNAAESILDTWNYKKDQPIPKNYHQIVLNTLITGEKHYTEFEYVCKKKNCVDKTFSLTFAPVEGTNYVNIYGFDITERKIAGEALRETEGILRSILNNTPDIIIMVDSKGVIQFINKPLQGLNVINATGMKIYDIIEPQHNEIVKKKIAEIFSTGYTESVKLKIPDLKGGKSQFEIRFGYIKSEWKTTATLLFFTDITEKNRIEQGLRESEEHFRRLIERSPLPITIVNINGKREYQNLKFLENYGYIFSEMPTIDDWFKKVHPDKKYRQKIIEAWNLNRVEIKTRKIKPSTLKIKCKDGSFRTVLVKMEYLGDNRIFFTYEDITELLAT